MPSLRPGYEFDIFISYRQNDNRTGWVTEFVKSLQEELAATLKDPVSVYFDQNPHNGLLETHHVDKSLEGKLKCLIFIPIISQTYCDPKSFAWQSEFCIFNQLAQQDELGRDIRLSNGNVASRILPVIIHDLDVQDRQTIEKEISGILRGVEFIYKEPGVNRPLKPTDKRDLNQNKTDYQNQVNKVANAVKEIINALTKPISSSVTETQESATTSETSSPKPNRWAAFTLIILAITVGALAYWYIQKKAGVESASKSIAVLPFTDLSPGHDQEYMADGIAEEIINALAQFDSLKVIARTSSFQFRGKNEDIRTIAEKLNVSHLLEGSVRISDDQLRITAKLIHGERGEEIWSKSYTRDKRDLFATQDEIALAVASAIKVATDNEFKPTKAPKNPQAYDLYLQGLYFHNRGTPDDSKKAREYFLKSLALDSTLLGAWNHLYGIADTPEEKKRCIEMAFRIDPNSPEALIMKAMSLADELDFRQANNFLRRALSQNLANPKVLRTAALVLVQLGDYPRAIQLARRALELDPLQIWSHYQLAAAYQANGEFGKAAEHFRRVNEMTGGYRVWELLEALVLDNRLDDAKSLPIDTSFQWYVDLLISQKENDRKKADSLFSEILTQNDWISRPFSIATLYAYRGEKDKAFEYLNAAKRLPDPDLTNLLKDPFLIPLRDDPRFLKLRRELGIPEN
jgi:TolB-like protein